MRVNRKTVTFERPFRFSGLDAEQPAGTYLVVTEEEQIPGLSFEAWRRVETSLRLPCLEKKTGMEQVVVINPHDLEVALAVDLCRPAPGTSV